MSICFYAAESKRNFGTRCSIHAIEFLCFFYALYFAINPVSFILQMKTNARLARRIVVRIQYVGILRDLISVTVGKDVLTRMMMLLVCDDYYIN